MFRSRDLEGLTKAGFLLSAILRSDPAQTCRRVRHQHAFGFEDRQAGRSDTHDDVCLGIGLFGEQPRRDNAVESRTQVILMLGLAFSNALW